MDARFRDVSTGIIVGHRSERAPRPSAAREGTIIVAERGSWHSRGVISRTAPIVKASRAHYGSGCLATVVFLFSNFFAKNAASGGRARRCWVAPRLVCSRRSFSPRA